MRHTSAFQTIERALATNSIGEPVAVRLIAQLADDPDETVELVTSLGARALAWLGDTVDTSFSLGDPRQQLNVLVRTTKGRSALISAGVCRANNPLVEVVVFGNRGVLSWEAGAGRGADTIGVSTLEVGSPEMTPGTCSPLAPPYGVLLVAGDHTHQPGYAQALLADGRCRLIGVVDEQEIPQSRQRLNQRLADRLGIPLLDSFQDALARDDVHIVSVCAEPYRRGRLIVQAARAGKHLYLDKPLAGSLADADAIVAAVRHSGVVAHMFSQVHGDPAQRVRAIVASGQLGDLIAIHCDVCFAKGHGGTADLTRPRFEQAVPERFELPDAKRELTNVGVYPVAMLLWLLRRDVKRVYGATGNFFFAEHQQRDMEDFGQMLLEFEGGVTATISAGRAGWRSHPGFGLHRVCLVGTQGAVTVDAHRPRVEVWSDAEPWSPPPRDPDDPMGMWAPLPGSRFEAAPKHAWALPTAAGWEVDAGHFLDCIEQGRSSEVSAEVGAAATEILLAAYRSAALRDAVPLPLPR